MYRAVADRKMKKKSGSARRTHWKRQGERLERVEVREGRRECKERHTNIYA